MHLPASRGIVPELLVRASSPSTNAELVGLARDGGLESFTTLVTEDQTAGRGRLDRSWSTPPGSALAVSVLISPQTPSGPLAPERYGWLPIAAGIAATRALRAVLPAASVAFKWPNDVLVGGRKLCGVLAELLPARGAVVIGAGINLAMTPEQLPVPTATSVAVEGGDPDPDTILAGYLTSLRELVEGYLATGGDAERSGLAPLARTLCASLDREVRVELPDGGVIEGRATGLDVDGHLIVDDARGRRHVVAAGDVTHARLEGPE
ncbi:MAG: biotin--[acetyl-CoA-carboxylase] ligase [Microbacteriaceae bacterium]|nr:biotin--[acetyl-CoA-carboxylase] ligase [Microbacteriaceae bacterium]